MALAVLAWAVETDHEKVARTLGTMASAAENGRADPFIERISPQYKNGPYGKDELAAIVTAALAKVRITAGDPVINIEDGPGHRPAGLHLRILPAVTSPLAQAQIPVTWEGKFAPDPDGEWRLRSATAIKPAHHPRGGRQVPAVKGPRLDFGHSAQVLMPEPAIRTWPVFGTPGVLLHERDGGEGTAD